MAALATAFFAWHRAQLASAPFATNMVQSGTLMALGDVAAQALERRACGAPDSAHKGSRTAILAAWSAGVTAPFWTWFFRVLHRQLPGRVLVWVAASAALSPAMNAAFFAYSSAATHAVEEGVDRGLRGDGLVRLRAKVRERLDSQLTPTVQRSMALWIPFNYINFRFVPLEVRWIDCGGTFAE
jgi:hypothetical protein